MDFHVDPLKSALALEYDLFIYLHLFDHIWYTIQYIVYSIVNIVYNIQHIIY
jgi:hypothetical protein